MLLFGKSPQMRDDKILEGGGESYRVNKLILSHHMYYVYVWLEVADQQSVVH